jgi:nucleoid DNA-binding protein
MFSKYIKSLLDLNSRVIIPDLGAFMLKPENSSIYFNEFLRFNDGLLVDHISEQEQIEKSNAANKVKSFVDEINKQLSSNRSVEIEGLGTLFMDTNEKIQFKDSKSIDFSVSPTVVPKSEKIIEKKENVVQEKNEIKIPEPQVNKTESQVTREEFKQPEIKQPVPEKKMPAKKKKPIISNQTPPNPSPMKNKSKTIILISAAILIIIAAAIYYVFYYEPGKNNLAQNITIGNDSTNTASNDPVNKSEGREVPAVTKKKVPTPGNIKSRSASTRKVKSSGNEKKYCLIAGSFVVEGNAERMVAKLKNDGYNAEKFFNQKKNLYYVSIAYFDNLSIATREMNRIKDTDNTITWIFQN